MVSRALCGRLGWDSAASGRAELERSGGLKDEVVFVVREGRGLWKCSSPFSLGKVKSLPGEPKLANYCPKTVAAPWLGFTHVLVFCGFVVVFVFFSFLVQF